MTKYILVLLVGVMMTACGSAENAAGVSPTTGSTCPAVSAVSVVRVDQNACPSSPGQWDAYEITKNSSGTITGIKRWCGNNGSFPLTQAMFNQYAVGPSDTTNSDYALDTTCVSGSKTTTTTDVTQYVWKKK
jgi:hypothetical protein